MSKNKKAIILGSGGARGLAHIGVWKVLAEMGLTDVDFIAGTSMGAIIGAMIADKLNIKDVYYYVSNMSLNNWISLFPPHFPISGFTSGKKYMKFLSHFFKRKKMESLKIPFGCVAFNYNLFREDFFESGNILDILRASASIPIIFDPYKIGEHYYLDGSLVNPIPIQYAIDRKIDHTLVVNVVRPPINSNYEQGIYKRINILQRKFFKKKKIDEPKLFEVALKTIEIVEWELVRKTIEQNKPEFYLDIDTSGYKTLDFHNAKELILLGENTALRNEKMLAKFLKL